MASTRTQPVAKYVMIAAGGPTSANSRSGTPAPRSDRARSPELTAGITASPADITDEPYCSKLRSLRRCCCERGDFHADDPGDVRRADRTGAQDARLDAGEVDDGGGGLLLGG